MVYNTISYYIRRMSSFAFLFERERLIFIFATLCMYPLCSNGEERYYGGLLSIQ